MRNHWLMLHKQKETLKRYKAVVQCSYTQSGEKFWANIIDLKKEIKFTFDTELHVWAFGVVDLVAEGTLENGVVWTKAFGYTLFVKVGDSINVTLDSFSITNEDGTITTIIL